MGLAGFICVRDACVANRLRTMIQPVNKALDASPAPTSEWQELLRVLGPALLARLLDIPATSLHRFQSGARATPGDVIVRLHALALMVRDLAGAYSNAGIRRWFVRPRTAPRTGDSRRGRCIKPLITAHYPLEAAGKALEDARTRKDVNIKVMVTP